MTKVSRTPKLEETSSVHNYNLELAFRTLNMEQCKGIPTAYVYIMDIPFMEEYSGHEPGDYRLNPEQVNLDFHRAVGTCLLDQFIPDNPLTMDRDGFNVSPSSESSNQLDTDEFSSFYGQHGTSDVSSGYGAQAHDQLIVRNGMEINSPEAVVEHLERFVFPYLQKSIQETQNNGQMRIGEIVRNHNRIQHLFGSNLVKIPFDPFNVFQPFPRLRYELYGYENYFMAYALYPEVMEKDFALQADLGCMRTRMAAQAYDAGNIPKVLRLDHDMADSRGLLVSIESLERIWFPHFARAIDPYLKAGIRLLWHCDGNLSEMLPRLIEAGIGGFQGFQYEDGMDYVKICRMKDRNKNPLMIWAGVSVTKTLPFGTPQDVKDELQFLVENGPRVGLFLSTSSSVTPGTPHENLSALIDGFRYFRYHGRT